MAVGFFLSPFVVHRLGNVAFGVWGLAVAVVAYMALLDLGLQSSVLRFVNKGHTQKDHKSASDAFSAAFWVRLQISVAITVLTLGLAAVFPHLFKIPPDIVRAAQLAVLLIGFKTVLNMSIGVYGAVLSALNRYDLQNVVSLVQTAIRVVGIVYVLKSGHGIVAIAVCELVAAIVSNALLVRIAHHLYPELRVRMKKPSRATLRPLWAYSAYAFLNTVAVQLVYQSDNLVVGRYVSVAAVTFYMVGNSLCNYANQVVQGIGGTFVPAASTYEASGDKRLMLQLYKNGTRLILAISLPMMITLILRGSTFISLWMGPEYAHTSGMVLLILSVARIFSFANRTAGSIAFGIEKHKVPAIWAISEGITNLILSIVLAHWFGIYGVALGTMIPSLIVQIFLWPGYVGELVGISRFEVLARIWSPIFVASLPYAAATYFVNAWYPVHSLLMFTLQVAALLPIFVIGLSLLFRTQIRGEILPRLRTFFLSEANT